ncbi:hypothetical protein X757_08810 [Mesorhizobium sp. LSHC414A00]|nr:hypothetical protein X757_08810 [Mesorhizobium sp. LSHC414A00]
MEQSGGVCEWTDEHHDGAERDHTIDALVAALDACIEDMKDSAQEIAENGGVTFDHDATWPEGSAIALAYAALALARGGK